VFVICGIPVFVILTEGRNLLVVGTTALQATADSSTAGRRFGMTKNLISYRRDFLIQIGQFTFQK
jgi:hypothetical protein